MKYVSLGGNCSVTYQLKKLNLKQESYPFDWCKITINQLLTVLENNFSDFESIKIKKLSENHLDKNNNSTYLLKNNYGITFAHELTDESQLIDFQEKIKRRINRFINMSEEITFIRIELCKPDKNYNNKIIKLNELLSNLFNNFKLIIFLNKEYKNENMINNIIYYDNYESDWKMNNINWELYLIK